MPLAAREIHSSLEATAEHLAIAAGQPANDGFSQALPRRGFDLEVVLAFLDLAHGDIFAGCHLVPHEVLKDHRGLAAQVLEVVLAQVHTVEQDLSRAGVVEPRQQLDHGSLALAVLADQRDPFARLESEIEVLEHQPGTAGIGERNVLKLEAVANGSGSRWGVGL